MNVNAYIDIVDDYTLESGDGVYVQVSSTVTKLAKVRFLDRTVKILPLGSITLSSYAMAFESEPANSDANKTGPACLQVINLAVCRNPVCGSMCLQR